MTVPIAAEAAGAVAEGGGAVAAGSSAAKTGGAKKVAEKKAATKKPPAKKTSKYQGSRAQKVQRHSMPFLRPPKSVVRYRQIIAVELIIGLIIILTQPNPVSISKKDFSDTLYQAACFLVVFIVLAMMTTGGPAMARISAGLGGLIILALLLKRNKVILAAKTSNPGNKTVNIFSGIIPPNTSGLTPIGPDNPNQGKLV